jgi:hypothetical protein
VPKPQNAFHPLTYVKEVGAATRKQRGEMRAASATETDAEIQHRMIVEHIRKQMAPVRKPPGPRYENLFPRTPEAMEAERQADELLRIKRDRRNAFAKSGS